MSGGLAGRRVAVTRPEPGAAELAQRLEAAGAVPVLLPLTTIVAAPDPAPLRAAVRRLRQFDWVVFTSANAVRSLRDAGPLPPDAAPRVAAVGPATAAAVRDLLGWSVAALPQRHAGDALVAAMAAVAPVAGTRVLWPRSASARAALPRDLARAGAVLEAPIAYRTVAVPGAAQRLATLLAQQDVDIVVLASPTAVEAFASAQPRTGGVVICVIGSTTGAVARDHGIDVHVEPRDHTIPALIESLQHYLSGHARGEH